MIITKYIPIIETIRSYQKENFNFDLVAGLTVGIMMLPQSMAYAMIAKVHPVYGIYTAIVASIIGAVFCSSNHLSIGPTNAISVLMGAGLLAYAGKGNFFEMLFLLTFLVGLIQLALGLLKLGSMVNYFSHALIVGFTAGAGLLIAMEQIPNILGVTVKDNCSALLTLIQVLKNLEQVNYYTLGLALFTLALIIICRLVNKKLPGPLLGIIGSTALVMIFSLGKQGVQLTGDIPAALPPFGMVHLNVQGISSLFGTALIIAIIGLVEAVSISKSIASLTGQKINANQEFLAQGLANIAGAFFGGIPSSGSFTRSAVTYQSGGKTRLAGAISGVFVLMALVCIKPIAKFIPSASLAAVLMIVAYSLIDQKAFMKILKGNLNDALVMIVTAGLTAFGPQLEYAVYAGLALSIILFLKDTGVASVRTLVPIQDRDGRYVEYEVRSGECDVVESFSIIQLEGNLYFGSATDLEQKLDGVMDEASVYLLRFKGVSVIDITSLDVIENFIKRAHTAGKKVMLSGVTTNIRILLEKANLIERLGEENVFMVSDEIFASSGKPLEQASSYSRNVHFSVKSHNPKRAALRLIVK